MKKAYFVDFTGLVSFGTCAIILLMASIYNAIILYYIGAVAFFIPGVLCLILALKDGSKVAIGDEGVCLQLLGLTYASYSWDQVKEIGVIGLKVLHRSSKNDVGRKFIYISPEKLDPDKRFHLALSWPPSNKLYFNYQSCRLREIQQYWKGELEFFNEGELEEDVRGFR